MRALAMLAAALWLPGLVAIAWPHLWLLAAAVAFAAACIWTSVLRPRLWAPEAALGGSLLVLWLAAPPTVGLRGLGAALAVGAFSAGYFLLRFSLRLPPADSMRSAAGTIRHGAQRILLLGVASAMAAWATVSLPSWLARSVGPRWAASVDSASLPLAAAGAIVALCAALGLRLVTFAVASRPAQDDATRGDATR